MLSKFVSVLGFQRSVLFSVVLLLIFLSLFSMQGYSTDGWQAVPTLIAPSLVPIMFFVLCLDIMMSLIYSIDETQDGKRRYKIIITVHLLSLVVMILCWIPFFDALLSI
jgi:hypothetical protein